MSESATITMHQQGCKAVHYQRLTKCFPGYEDKKQACSVKISSSHESLQVLQGLWNSCFCTIFPCSSSPQELWQKRVKLRKRLTVAHYQEGNKHQVNRCLRYQVKSSLCKMETFAQKGQQLIADCQHPVSDMGKKILTSFYSTSVLVLVLVLSLKGSIKAR